MGEHDKALDWAFWADQLNASRLLSRSGVDLGRWALGVLRKALGDEWLMKAYTLTKSLPPEVTRPAGYAPAFALLIATALRLDQFANDRSAEQVVRDVVANPDKWEHATIQFEVASLMRRQGYDVWFEPAIVGERSADVSVMGPRGGPTNIEVTRLGPAVGTRHYHDAFDELRTSAQLIALQGGVEVMIDVRREPAPEHLDLHQRRLRACALGVAISGGSDTFWCGPIKTSVTRGDGGLVSLQGHPYSPPSWRRLLKRVKRKIRQTEGGASAWLRIDVVDGLWQIHEFAKMTLPEKTLYLERELRSALDHAPHVLGAAISSGPLMAQGEFEDEDAFPSAQAAGLRRVMSPGLVRENVFVAKDRSSDLARCLVHSYADESRWREEALAERHLPAVRRWLSNWR